MKSSNHVHKLPFQTKIVFTFVLLLTVALVSKWTYYSFLMSKKPTGGEMKFSGIRLQINDICLREESKSLKVTSESTEEDQDWMNFKAPEYCKCVSSRMVHFWSEHEKLDEVVKINNEELPQFISTQLKNEDTKGLIDFCLSKAQKISSKKVTASAAKN